MIDFLLNTGSRNCEGTTRRDFLRVGGLGLGAGVAGVTLSDLMRGRAAAADTAKTTEKSVIWLWLGGGPTQVETFDPKMTAPSEYRSVTGEVQTVLPGVTLGGNFERMAQVADRMAFVRSFAHTNSGHSGGTHYVMTGYDNRLADNGAVADRPFLGSIVSRVRGTNHPVTGLPTFVRLGGSMQMVLRSSGQRTAPSIQAERLARTWRSPSIVLDWITAARCSRGSITSVAKLIAAG